MHKMFFFFFWVHGDGGVGKGRNAACLRIQNPRKIHPKEMALRILEILREIRQPIGFLHEKYVAIKWA